MSNHLHISIAAVKYGKNQESDTVLDVYYNDTVGFEPKQPNQVHSTELDDKSFLLGMSQQRIQEDEDSYEDAMDTFSRVEKKIRQDETSLDDAAILIEKAITDMISINREPNESSEQETNNYLCLYSDGEKVFCVNNGCQSAFYFTDVDMFSLTPMSESPERLRKLGIISEEQAALVERELMQSAKKIHVSKKILLSQTGVFIVMNRNMAKVIDQMVLEAYLEDFDDPELTANRLIKEAGRLGAKGELSITLLAVEVTFDQEWLAEKKKKDTGVLEELEQKKTKEWDKAKEKSEITRKKDEQKQSAWIRLKKNEPDERKKLVPVDHDEQEDDVPDAVDDWFDSPDDSVNDIDEENTKDISDLQKKSVDQKTSSVKDKQKRSTKDVLQNQSNAKSRKRAVSYFISRMITLIVIVLALTGVVVGLVNISAWLFADAEGQTETTGSATVPTNTGTERQTTQQTTNDQNGQTQTGTQTTTAQQTTLVTTADITTLVTTISPEEPMAIHVVRSGDTLSQISQLYYNNSQLYHLIMAENDLQSDLLRIGQELRIPPLPDED